MLADYEIFPCTCKIANFCEENVGKYNDNRFEILQLVYYLFIHWSSKIQFHFVLGTYY